MLAASCLTAFQLQYARKTKNPIQEGTGVFFVILWLAVFSFTSQNTSVSYRNFSLTLKELEFIALLPLTLVWVMPYNQDKFFGIQDLQKTDKLHAIWRLSVLLLIIVNIVPTGNEWYWKGFEFIVLLPMINETVNLQNRKDEKLPVLTLFIQTEISEKFDVPISLMKSVFLILVAFVFGLLNSRIWLLIILIYFAVGAGWTLYSLIPQDMRAEEKLQSWADETREKYGKDNNRRRRRRERKNKSKEEEEPIETTSLISHEEIQALSQPENIQEKALALGQKVRTGIEKPYYTLNHILSTLKEEDFSHAWRVPKNGLKLPSTRGKWSPPKDLILFPVELEKYDYRRADQILLLGFNRPLDSPNKVNISFGEKKEEDRPHISDNKIKFGNVEFNTRSLIVTKEQWSEIKGQLDVVTAEDDISHTGFKNLTEMQKTLVSMSDKWMEVRFTAQEAAVNFLAGLLGSSEPIFMPKPGENQNLITGKLEDTNVEDV